MQWLEGMFSDLTVLFCFLGFFFPPTLESYVKIYLLLFPPTQVFSIYYMSKMRRRKT